jgi:predicted phage-related endonuclease
MLCHLDRVIIGEKKIVECKSSSGFLRPAWGESGSDSAPLHYILQVQHQLACSGYQDADIAALIDIDDYRIYPMPRNEKIIAKIESACEQFWHEHVLADVPPAPVNRADLKLMYPLNNGKFIEASSEAMQLIDLISGLKLDIKNLTEEKTKAEKELIEIIADNDGLLGLEGKPLLTFQANKNGIRTLRIK